MRRLSWLAPLAFGGCFLVNSNEISITYDVTPPQEFAQDFGSQTGSLMDVSCAASPTVCAAIPAPAGTTAACDSASKKCVLNVDVRPYQTVNLSQQSSFPSQVANSSVISHVDINNVFFWTATNTLSFDTPPIDLYIGPQTIRSETDAGAVKLGTLPPQPAGKLTAKSALPLTDAGKQLLATLAKDYKTPFNVLAVIHLTVTGGQPVPSGKIDLFVQPEIGFGIPLK